MDTKENITIIVPEDVDMALVVGPHDSLLRLIEQQFHADISLRGNKISIEGSSLEVDILQRVFSEIISYVQEGFIPDASYVKRVLDLLHRGDFSPQVLRKDILLTYRGRSIRPKTAGQKHYVDAIRNSTITFGLGPAGTGKTYLAVALAYAALQRKEVGRLILTRPVVEAGESLGFLPGSLEEKIDPYIRPLYDALYNMADAEKINRLVEDGIIEIVPLAFMRGRTLDDAFVILDEAQNTTPEQMKMFLTRLGFNSKMVVTGDASQVDLPFGTSGLGNIEDILQAIDDISFCHLTGKDVVRHSLVAKIVEAYARA